MAAKDKEEGRLPASKLQGTMSLEEAIQRRRSVREFKREALTAEQIGQLCWAGQGITDEASGHRASPSAGALFPIELYVVTAEGVSRYEPKGHRLARHRSGDYRRALQAAALGQETIGAAPACFVITALVERTARKYGDRAERYCLLEAGHVAQNVLLQATALGLAGVPVGACQDAEISRSLELPEGRRLVYLIPVGQAAG